MSMSAQSRLLAANRSFMGVREAPRPYHDVEAGFLPHFSEAPPRFAANREAIPGPLFEQTGEAAPASGDHGPASTSGGAAEPAFLPPVESTVSRAAARPEPARGWREPAALIRRLLWTGSLAGMARPRAVRRPTQGELSLAAIQVKRNDLVDADLELVRAAKAKPAAASGTPFWRKWFGGRPTSAA